MADYFGDNRDNRFSGDETNNVAQGKGGADRLSGNDGSDVLAGGTGADILNGGADPDTLYSFEITSEYDFGYYARQPTRPTMDDGAEVDLLSGGDGDDLIFAGYGDSIDGGEGFDRVLLSFRGATAGIDADFSVFANGGSLTIGGATIANLEAVYWIDGTDLDDSFTLSPIESTNGRSKTPIYGWGGNDHITLGYHGGNAYGGDGDDIIDDSVSGDGGYLYGDAGDDTIHVGDGSTGYGGTGEDRIFGSAGNDTLYGGFDDDILDGGRSTDTLAGEAGTDQLYGGEGNDVLDGGDDNDLIYGDTGYVEPYQPDGQYSDLIYGGTGADTIYGEAGNDRLYAGIFEQYGYRFDTGAEKDVLSGGIGDDIISVGIDDDADGGEGADTLFLSFAASNQGITLRTPDLISDGYHASAGTLTGFERIGGVRGSEFADRIAAASVVDGGGGGDYLTALLVGVDLFGGAGDDVLVSARGENRLSGGDGSDTAHYARFDTGIKVYLGGEDFTQGYGPDGDELVDIENVTGSRFADQLYGNYLDNRLTGGFGDDTLKAYGGDDTLYGGVGVDTLFGQEGDDILDGGVGADSMSGGLGSDTYIVDDAGDLVYDYPSDAGGIDTVRASADFILPDFIESLFLTGHGHSGTGNGLGNRIVGSGGADVLSGRGGKDIVLGGAGRDGLNGGNGDDTLTGGGGRDTLTGGTGADTFRLEQGHVGAVFGKADHITDFNHLEGDQLDLNGVDAIASTPAVDRFAFIGNAAFSGVAGELRYGFVKDGTIVSADTDGDATGDLFILLDGRIALVEEDFALGGGTGFVAIEIAAFEDTDPAPDFAIMRNGETPGIISDLML